MEKYAILPISFCYTPHDEQASTYDWRPQKAKRDNFRNLLLAHQKLLPFLGVSIPTSRVIPTNSPLPPLHPYESTPNRQGNLHIAKCNEPPPSSFYHFYWQLAERCRFCCISLEGRNMRINYPGLDSLVMSVRGSGSLQPFC